MDQIQTSQANQMPHISQGYTQPVSEDSKLQNTDLNNFPHTSLQSQRLTYQEVWNHHVNTVIPQQTLVRQQQMQQHILSGTVNNSETSHSMPLVQQYVMPVNDMILRNGSEYYDQCYRQEINKLQEIKKMVPKMEPDDLLCNKTENKKQENSIVTIETDVNKKRRHKVPEPSTWQCNIRKLKHQKGEAYIDRRGKFVPEKTIKNRKNCLTTCILKCSERVDDAERLNIFKAFYSLKWSEKKHFILSTTERNITKLAKMHGDVNDAKRKYVFKYFFMIRGEKKIVCKQFYLGTLAISQKPVYNVHNSKSELNIPKPDGRGLSESSAHVLAEELKYNVRNHIMSFKTVEDKPVIQNPIKKQYLQPLLNFKKMYTMYLNECHNENVEAVKESMYRKILKNEFNLGFKKIKIEEEVLCTRCKAVVKKEKKTKKT